MSQVDIPMDDSPTKVPDTVDSPIDASQSSAPGPQGPQGENENENKGALSFVTLAALNDHSQRIQDLTRQLKSTKQHQLQLLTDACEALETPSDPRITAANPFTEKQLRHVGSIL